MKWLKILRLYRSACFVLQLPGASLAWIRRSLDWTLTEAGFPLHAPGYRTRLAFYSQFVHNGDFCFDIGANLGDRTEVVIALGATAVAVEPQDYCVQRLRKKFRKSQRVIVVPKAVGDKEGEAEMMLSNFHPLSSISTEWVNSVKAGHRLGGFRWDKKVTVPVTTMKRLIEEYGRPGFCKIDVEGFESQVLSTLSEPIDIVSLEYNPEFTEAAICCVNHLSAIGMNHFNYSIGESMCFALQKWITPGGMCSILKSLPDNMVHGDVYAMSEDGYSRYISLRSSPAHLLAD